MPFASTRKSGAINILVNLKLPPQVETNISQAWQVKPFYNSVYIGVNTVTGLSFVWNKNKQLTGFEHVYFVMMQIDCNIMAWWRISVPGNWFTIKALILSHSVWTYYIKDRRHWDLRKMLQLAMAKHRLYFVRRCQRWAWYQIWCFHKYLSLCAGEAHCCRFTRDKFKFSSEYIWSSKVTLLCLSTLSFCRFCKSLSLSMTPLSV